MKQDKAIFISQCRVFPYKNNEILVYILPFKSAFYLIFNPYHHEIHIGHIFLCLSTTYNMKKLFLFVLLFSISFSIFAQDSLSLKSYFEQKKIKPTLIADELYYSITKKGSDKKPKKGDFLKINYVGKLLNDKVFEQNQESIVFQLGLGQVQEFMDLGLEKVTSGSKTTFYVPPSMAFGERGAGDVPPNTPVMYEIELLQILSTKEYDAYILNEEQKEQVAFELRKKQQHDTDKKLINDYAISKKIKAKRSDTGLSYAITKNGKGENVKNGDQIFIEYEGFFMNGDVFDGSTKNKKPFDFVIGNQKTIAGWEEGLLNFNKGSEGFLLVPSALAYGPSGLYTNTTVVPENSCLVFKIKIVDIRKKK
jgi:FKBP-type peptidyl-prolyl cis-trans isomerase